MKNKLYNQEMAELQKKVALSADMVAQRQATLAALAPKPAQFILELGSGNGIYLNEIFKEMNATGKVVGIDSSPAMIEMARHICPAATFIEASATDLPFEDQSFHAICASQVFCFIEDIDQALSEAWRVLKPGGKIVILDTHWDSLIWNCQNKTLFQKIKPLLTKTYAWADAPQHLPRRLTRQGFRVTDKIIHNLVNWTYQEDCYAAFMIEYLKNMQQQESCLGDQDIQTWIDDQYETDRKQEYLFALNRYIFVAIK